MSIVRGFIRLAAPLLAVLALSLAASFANAQSRAATGDAGFAATAGPEPELASVPAAVEPGPGKASGLLPPLVEQRLAAFEKSVSTPQAADQRWRRRTEQVLARLVERAPASVRPHLERAATPKGRRMGLLLVGGLAIAFFVLRLLRGHGDLVVAIDYPAELDGVFSVRVEQKPGRARPSSKKDRRKQKKAASTRTEHHEVGRETQFQHLRPRRYYVVLEGQLLDSEDGELIESCLLELPVDVRRNESARLSFSIEPKDCPVDLRMLWDKRPAKEAAVAIRGQLHSVRYANGGATRVRLAKGHHVIMIGSGDRVCEHIVEIDRFGHQQIEVDLASGSHILFKGCPPAIEPYLNGDTNGAARALERDGQSEVASLLLGRMHLDGGDRERAAEQFENAGRAREAAELWASSQVFDKAGALFEAAGEPLRAAEMYRSAGDLLRAGAAYETGQDLTTAIDCYREAGDTERWLDALERGGEPFEAGRVALAQEDRGRAIRLLQRVASGDPNYGAACSLLADAYEGEGHRDMAAQKLDELIQAEEGRQTEPAIFDRAATLHEETGDYGRALSVLEQLREREPTYPNLATRVESLRKRVSSDPMSDTATAVAPINLPAGFADGGRYEIESELGRGGMGVVFQARDKRLDRVVALKRLPDNLRDHPKAIQLFLREAQASARLNHPNIVTLYDVDCIEGAYFITMELLEGHPLNVLLKQKGRLKARDVVRLGHQVATGLAYAHQQRIVHRDIKTANLFFTHDRVVKIMDFGLAKMMEEVRRASTVIGGTPYYMAPEQATGGAVDHRADLYAFGVTLYELATGTVPFSEGDVVYQHRHEPAPDPRTRVAIPDALAELILAMIEKDPAQRVGSAGEVGQRLEQMLPSLS